VSLNDCGNTYEDACDVPHRECARARGLFHYGHGHGYAFLRYGNTYEFTSGILLFVNSSCLAIKGLLLSINWKIKEDFLEMIVSTSSKMMDTI
jgi:hypothetical protein